MNTENNNLDLSGNWNCELITPAGNSLKMKIILKQNGRKLEGNIDIDKRLADHKTHERKAYILTGKIKSAIAMINIENTDENAPGFICQVLEIKNSNMIKGKAVWHSVTDKVITSAEVEWSRIIE